MKSSGKCPKCGSNHIQGPNRIEIHSNMVAKIVIKLKNGTAALQAHFCVDCGNTELYPDEKGMENLKES